MKEFKDNIILQLNRIYENIEKLNMKNNYKDLIFNYTNEIERLLNLTEDETKSLCNYKNTISNYIQMCHAIERMFITYHLR